MPWWEGCCYCLKNICQCVCKLPSRHLYLLFLLVIEGVLLDFLQWVVVTVKTQPVTLPRESDYSYSIVAQCWAINRRKWDIYITPSISTQDQEILVQSDWKECKSKRSKSVWLYPSYWMKHSLLEKRLRRLRKGTKLTKVIRPFL